jgi:Flp pilus assembly protein TadG
MTRSDRQARRRDLRADGGAAAVLLVLLTPVFLALAGLVLDGGRAIAARQQAADLAEQAARAGAGALDVTTLRASGQDTINPAAAQAAACRYVTLSQPGDGCRATVTAGQVTVTVATSTPTVLLGLIGINTFHTTGWATATAVTGISTPDGTS